MNEGHDTCFMKASQTINYAELLHILQHLRHGLVVRIAGSHPAGPGSIPGAGIFIFVRLHSSFHKIDMVNKPNSLRKVFFASCLFRLSGLNRKIGAPIQCIL